MSLKLLIDSIHCSSNLIWTPYNYIFIEKMKCKMRFCSANNNSLKIFGDDYVLLHTANIGWMWIIDEYNCWKCLLDVDMCCIMFAGYGRCFTFNEGSLIGWYFTINVFFFFFFFLQKKKKPKGHTSAKSTKVTCVWNAHHHHLWSPTLCCFYILPA